MKHTIEKIWPPSIIEKTFSTDFVTPHNPAGKGGGDDHHQHQKKLEHFLLYIYPQQRWPPYPSP